jgi:hypothetical protein
VNKKEAKKTLIPVGVGPAGAPKAQSGAKVFCFFFSKKKCFLPSQTASCRYPEPIAP